MKKLLKIFFVFILPIYFLLSFFSRPFSWSVVYYYGNKTSTEQTMRGFPFPDDGLFYEMNSIESSSSGTINWFYYLCNVLILLSLSFLVYYFLLRKLIFYSKTRLIILSVLVTLIYVKFGAHSIMYFFNDIDYDYGKWPDKIEIKDFHYSLRYFRYWWF